MALTPEAKLYVSWAVSCLLAGCIGLALYRGLYVFILLRARSTLIMLVATLGVLMTISALLIMTFSNTTHALPESLGNESVSSAARLSRRSHSSASAARLSDSS